MKKLLRYDAVDHQTQLVVEYSICCQVKKTYQGRAGMTMLSLKPKFMTPIQILKPEIDKLFALMDFHKEVRIHKIFPSMN